MSFKDYLFLSILIKVRNLSICMSVYVCLLWLGKPNARSGPKIGNKIEEGRF